MPNQPVALLQQLQHPIIKPTNQTKPTRPANQTTSQTNNKPKQPWTV
jgi:hypothetical protein